MISVINFPCPDSDSAAKTLETILVNSARLTGNFPKAGLLLKIKEGEDGKQKIVRWGVVDPLEFVSPQLKNNYFAEVNSSPFFPNSGIILKIREDDKGEKLVNWVLAGPAQIEMLAVGLSLSPE